MVSLTMSFQVYSQLPHQSPQMPEHAIKTSVAIGMFDGVHVGHRSVLASARNQALSHAPVMRSGVLTFSNHPQTLLSQTPPRQLSTLAERLALFQQLGMDAVWAVPFDEAFRDISATDFVNEWLVNRLNVGHVSVGYDFCFGRGREGNGDVLKHLCHQAGITVEVVAPVRACQQIASSTLIRKLLTFGDVDTAAALLERPYSLMAPVVQGLQRGRTLGFPTANLDTKALQGRLLPGIGTYAGWSCVLPAGEKEKTPVVWPAVCNIGFAPTFGDVLTEQIEVHVLGQPDLSPYGGSLYGHTLGFAFTHRLRDEQFFDGPEALVAQIQRDCDTALSVLGDVPPPVLELFPGYGEFFGTAELPYGNDPCLTQQA